MKEEKKWREKNRDTECPFLLAHNGELDRDGAEAVAEESLFGQPSEKQVPCLSRHKVSL